jgi:uncharacterized membrane protein
MSDPRPEQVETVPVQAAQAHASAEPVAVSPELMISALLRYGVLTSLALVFVGTVLTFLHHPEYLGAPEVLDRLTSPPSGPHRLAEVVHDVMEVKGQAVVMVGLWVLMLIPVLRVALSLFVFRVQRDTAYARMTAFVLAMLVLAFALGGAE